MCLVFQPPVHTMVSSKCKRVSPSCRKLSAGRSPKAGKSCKHKSGSTGSKVSGYYRPKNCQKDPAQMAATKLQAIVRRMSSQKKLKKKHSSVTKLQAALRGKLARKNSFTKSAKPSSSSIPLVKDIKAGMKKVKNGETFRTEFGTYMKESGTKHHKL